MLSEDVEDTADIHSSIAACFRRLDLAYVEPMTYYSPHHRNPEMEDFEQAVHRTLPYHFGQFLDAEPVDVFEPISDHMHLHLYMWAPTPRRNVWTISTAGMSAHRMNTPPGFSHFSRAELVITLPADWPSLAEIQTMPAEMAATYQWPFEELAAAARLPYLSNTWLGRGHTIRGQDAADKTFDGSEFSALLLDAVTSLPPEAMSMEVAGTTVHFLGLYPLYRRELEYILDRELTGHEWFHRCLNAGFHEGLFIERPILV